MVQPIDRVLVLDVNQQHSNSAYLKYQPLAHFRLLFELVDCREMALIIALDYSIDSFTISY